MTHWLTDQFIRCGFLTGVNRRVLVLHKNVQFLSKYIKEANETD